MSYYSSANQGGPYGGAGGSSSSSYGYTQSTGGYGSNVSSKKPSTQYTNNNDDWFTDQTSSTSAASTTTTSYGQTARTAAPPPPMGGTTYTPYGVAPQQGSTTGSQQQASFYGQPAQTQRQTGTTQNAAFMPSPMNTNNSGNNGGGISSGPPSSGNLGASGSGSSLGNRAMSTDELASSLSGSIGGGPPTTMKGAVSGAPISGNAPMNFNIGGGGYSDIDFENEPPLLDELGINIGQIVKKTKTVILPVGHTASIDIHLMDDDDLAGPLAYAMMLGGELLLSGKISFDVIYGFGLFGCLAMTLIINLMTPKVDAVSVWRVMSILGYCLIPVNVLAALNLVLFLKYRGALGVIIAFAAIVWCTVASTRLFERSCDMRNQRYLIAYPIMLLYTSFVIITIF